MKTNTVSIDRANKVTNITTTFSIPFMEWKDGFVEEAAMNWEEVLHRFSGVIVKALEDRMAACMAMLGKNLFNIVYSNEHTIVYKKENGKYHNFNHASYKTMEDAINMFTVGDVFNLELPHFDQIMKALVWVENREDVQGISFGNLVSCIMELTLGKAQER
jgi:predicted mannosyl-3-phosphoglycerate phosphatase (HAD superfamily)